MQPMTAERLEQYRDLKREIHMLEESIRELTEQAFHPVSDSVSGSMLEFPYIKRVVKIVGMDETSMQRIERRKVRLAQRKAEAEKKVEEIEAWVEAIPDSLIRQIVQYRYIRDMSWTATAHRLGYKSESGARMALGRYLEENKSCAFCAISP